MNVLSSTVCSFIIFIPLAIETYVRERKSCALSSGRIPEAMRAAPMPNNAPVITNNVSKRLKSFYTNANIISSPLRRYNYHDLYSDSAIQR